jgi:hypothetical protein
MACKDLLPGEQGSALADARLAFDNDAVSGER